MKKTLLLSSLAVAGMTLSAAATTNATPQDQKTCSASKATTVAMKVDGKDIVETALAAGQFDTLATALGAAGLVEALQGEGPFTVFAPTDDAFAKLPKDTLAWLLKPENKGALTNILTFHVVPGRVAAAGVVKVKNASALNGQRIDVTANDDGVTVAGAKVVKTDIACSNGIIHVVDTVMMPASKNLVETAVDNGSFSTLAAALQAGDLVEALSGDGPFTVFAPTDAAFAKLPEGTLESLLKPENKGKLVDILKYHVVSGRVYSDQLENGHVATLSGKALDVKLSDKGAFLGDVKIVSTDIDTTNGVIHVVDSVLLP